MKYLTTIFLSVLISGLIFISGCEKDTDLADTQPQTQTETAAEQSQSAVTEATKYAAEQTHCPIMGGEINKDYFVEYNGKKVYFCCPGCEEKFNEDPEKYISKLPQFKK